MRRGLPCDLGLKTLCRDRRGFRAGRLLCGLAGSDPGGLVRLTGLSSSPVFLPVLPYSLFFFLLETLLTPGAGLSASSLLLVAGPSCPRSSSEAEV